MNDSNAFEPPAAHRQRNRRERIEAIKRWVTYIEDQPPSVWGAQQNRLVNSQLESARQSGLDVAIYQRVRRAGRADRTGPDE